MPLAPQTRLMRTDNCPRALLCSTISTIQGDVLVRTDTDQRRCHMKKSKRLTNPPAAGNSIQDTLNRKLTEEALCFAGENSADRFSPHAQQF